jgi:hypothetical protein
LTLLNDITSANLGLEIFPELKTAITMFLVLPVSVASGERSFSQMNFIDNELQSCMTQEKLNSMATIEHYL